MSRIINCETNDNCKPWRAPNLDGSNENDFDFKLTDTNSISHRQQQEKIRQQSYEKSYAKGYMEGLAQGQKEIQQQVKNLHSLMASLTMPLPEIDNQVVDELVQLCIAIVKQMIRRELKAAPDEIVAVVREAISLLPVAASEITLELHPDDAKIIKQALVSPDAQASWKISEDALLTRGGCRVLTKSSRIDATVEKRMNTIIAEVMGSERNADR